MKREKTRLRAGLWSFQRKEKTSFVASVLQIPVQTSCSGWSSKEPEKKHNGADGFRVSHGLRPWRISVESQNRKQSSSWFSDRIQSKLNIKQKHNEPQNARTKCLLTNMVFRESKGFTPTSTKIPTGKASTANNTAEHRRHSATANAPVVSPTPVLDL